MAVMGKATRHAFGEAFQELFEMDKRVVGVTADLFLLFGLSEFARLHRERCFNVGVAEQNLIGVAAGLATSGKIPFAMTLAFLACLRAIDQVKMSVAYSDTNVKIVVSHGGLFVGRNGPSHEGLCDLAIMRALPNMTIVIPCDEIETKKATFVITEHNGPVYFRLSRPPAPVIHKEDMKFVLGRALTLREGSDVSIICVGSMVSETLLAVDLLSKEGINAKVLEMHTIKPIDEEAIIEAAEQTRCVVTVEDHNIIGGLGSAVAEVLGERMPVSLQRIGVRDVFSESGSDDELKLKYGMTANDVVMAARRSIELRKRI